MEEGENIWGCKKIFHSQNESETSSILSSEEGRHLTWGIIDEEHKGSDFLKELLTTWIGRGRPGQHLANQTGSLCDPLRQCNHDVSCKLSASQATTFCRHLYFWSCKKKSHNWRSLHLQNCQRRKAGYVQVASNGKASNSFHKKRTREISGLNTFILLQYSFILWNT